MKDDKVYLRHIRECIRRIHEDVAGGRERFIASHTVQDAVLRNLETLSESTIRLSEGLKTAHPEIDWRPHRSVSERARPQLPWHRLG